jgi:hypothetical protein
VGRELIEHLPQLHERGWDESVLDILLTPSFQRSGMCRRAQYFCVSLGSGRAVSASLRPVDADRLKAHVALASPNVVDNLGTPDLTLDPGDPFRFN